MDIQGHNEVPGGRPVKYRRVTEDGRQRAVRACDNCRRVKEKCEEGIPCKRCRHLKRQCQVSQITARRSDAAALAADQPRARVQEDYDITGGELIRRHQYLERIVKYHHPELQFDIASLEQKVHSLELSRASSLITPARLSSPEDEEDITINQEECTVDAVDANVAHYSGEFSHWNFSMRIKRHVENLETSGAIPPVRDSERVPDYWRVEKLQSHGSSIKESLNCLPPRPISQFLTHVFFSHASSPYYFVDRRWVEMKLESAYREQNSLSAQDAGAIAIVLSILAVGCQYAHLESSSEAGSGQSSSENWQSELGNMFYSHSVRLLPELIHLGSLESVQACSLLALYSLPLDASGLGYIYVNLAIKLAIQNGMHRKPRGDSFTASTIEARNRTWWTAYCIEKMVGIFHGRPISLASSEVDADLPKDNTGFSSIEGGSYVSNLRVMIQLIRHLESFFGLITLLSSGDRTQTSKTLARLVSAKNDLVMWWSALGSTESVDSTSNQIFSRATKHIHLVYCLVRMFVGRTCLLSRPQQRHTPAEHSSASPHDDGNESGTPHSRAESTASNRATNVSDLVQDCTEAAKEAIEICQSLHDSKPGLAHASYLEYSSCRAALLVLIAICIEKRSDRLLDVLQTGLNLIRKMSATGESARSEIMLIESLERALKRLLHPNARSSKRMAAGPASSKIAYEQFRQWGSSWRTGSMATTQDSNNSPTNQSMRAEVQEQQQQHPDNFTWMPGNAAQLGNASPSDMTNFDYLQLAARSTFFDFEDWDTSAGVMQSQYHPERQSLENFLSMPDYNTTSEVTYSTQGSTPHSAHRSMNF